MQRIQLKQGVDPVLKNGSGCVEISTAATRRRWHGLPHPQLQRHQPRYNLARSQGSMAVDDRHGEQRSTAAGG